MSPPPPPPCPLPMCSVPTRPNRACPGRRSLPAPRRPSPIGSRSRAWWSWNERVTEPCDRSATELAASLRSGEVSAEAIVESSLARIELVDGRVHAFLTVTADAAREQAAEVDRRIAAGEDLPAAAGIPLALKDVLCTRGITTTCGSRILRDYVPPYDCTPWARLRSAGSVLVGKTNCDEFAMGSSGENSAFGAVGLPHQDGADRKS